MTKKQKKKLKKLLKDFRRDDSTSDKLKKHTLLSYTNDGKIYITTYGNEKTLIKELFIDGNERHNDWIRIIGQNILELTMNIRVW
jgi:hypothetical protein